MRRVLAVVLAMGLGAACGAGGGAGDGDGRPRVVAAFYPLYEAAQRVGGERVQVSNLTPAGSEPHDLELSSGQVDRIEDAAVVLFLGRGVQPALEKAAQRAKGIKVDVLTASTIAVFLARRPGWLRTQRYVMGSVLGALALRLLTERSRTATTG